MDNSKSIKTTWSIINSLINPIQKNNTKISVLDIHRKEIKDETIEIKFNEHFIQIGSKLTMNICSRNTSFSLKIVIIIHYLYLQSQVVRSLKLLIIFSTNI